MTYSRSILNHSGIPTTLINSQEFRAIVFSGAGLRARHEYRVCESHDDSHSRRFSAMVALGNDPPIGLRLENGGSVGQRATAHFHPPGELFRHRMMNHGDKGGARHEPRSGLEQLAPTQISLASGMPLPLSLR
jgi:hypothetical protein